MSNAVFPSGLIGKSWGSVKTPSFKTKIQESVSGRESRAAMMAYPLWTFKVSYEYLSPVDLSVLAGFFLARKGQADSFLFDDVNDNTVINQQIGIGDGSNKYFQLVRSFGGFIEPCENINGSPIVVVDDALASGYSVSSTGLVTFTTAPAAGLVVAWTGSYYFRCRFLQDNSEFAEFLSQFFELKSLAFKGSTANKV
jgi:uncharacterized protein (TIGR02217 family)